MSAAYPGAVPALTRPTHADPAADGSATDATVVVDAISDEVEAIATELGTNPSGSAATVAARLDTLPVIGTARRLLAGIPPLAAEPPVVWPGSVTVALGTAGASPTIASAVRIAPKRLSSTVIDTAGDPHFEWEGAIAGRLLVSSGDMTYPDYLTGGTSQSRRNSCRVTFVHTGTDVELYFRMRTTTFEYRLWIDGQPVTQTPQTAAVTTSQRYYLKLTFPTTAPRRIGIEVTDPEFGGVAVGPTDSVTRPKAGLLLATLGDSHTSGANGVNWHDTWVRRCAGLLGASYANLGIGGSGYLNDNGTTGANFRNRIAPDLVAVNPDVVMVEGSWNDGGSTPAALTAEAAYVFDTIKAALPGALLIATGPWVNGNNASATFAAFESALKAQAQASGWHGFVSFRDPERLVGSATAWAGSTAYVVGDVRSYNGYAQLCKVAHTSTGSFDQTKWRSLALVNGSGKAGSTTGDGNADVVISSDGNHATALGHSVKSRHVAAQIARIATSVAAGIAWAG